MSSPFKFLDAYEARDQAIFFGRTAEIDELYALVFQSDLLLVYGASGTGKTSLVQCGLAGRFKPTDRFELLVRRKENLNVSLDREIRRQALTPIDDGASLADAVQSLYLDHLRPVHLIFDQFEELFLLGTPDEQRRFVDSVASLLSRQVACKIVIVMREEFIAMLYEFEKTLPRLFAKRFRVEPMSLENVTRVITGTTAACGIELEQGEATARQIIDNLSDRHDGIQLSYLQVYLDKLYREAVRSRPQASAAAAPVVFSQRLVHDTGALDDVLATFLEEQTRDIQQQLTAAQPRMAADAVQLVLEEFATLGGTKQPIARAELATRLPALAPVLDSCLAALARSRVVRQTEEVYELSHDALARRIADNRSAERKAVLKVQRIVKDRVSGYEQTKTLLSKEELALATPYLEKLGLSEGEQRFVTKSRWRLRRRLLATLVLSAVVVVVILVFAVATVAENERAENTIGAARQVVDELMATVNGRLASIPTEAARAAQRDLMAIASRLNETLNQQDAEGEANAASSTFWTEKVAGDLALDQGDVEAAEAHYGKAMAIAEREASQRGDDPDWQRNLAVGHRGLGDIEVRKANLDGARTRFAAAFALIEPLAASAGDDNTLQRDLAIHQGLVGQVELQAGRLAEARPALVGAVAIAERLARADAADTDLQRDLAYDYGQLALLEGAEERYDAARDAFAKAVPIVAALVKADPQHPVWRQDLAVYLSGLGAVLRSSGQPDLARQSITEALQVEREALQADPKSRMWLGFVLTDARQLGALEAEAGALPNAREALTTALQVATALAEADPANPAGQRDVAVAHGDLAAVLARGGRRADARGSYAEAIAIMERLAKDDPATPQWQDDVRTYRQALADLDRGGRR